MAFQGSAAACPSEGKEIYLNSQSIRDHMALKLNPPMHREMVVFLYFPSLCECDPVADGYPICSLLGASSYLLTLV